MGKRLGWHGLLSWLFEESASKMLQLVDIYFIHGWLCGMFFFLEWSVGTIRGDGPPPKYQPFFLTSVYVNDYSPARFVHLLTKRA